VSNEVLLPAPTRVHLAPTFSTGPHDVVTRMCEWRLSGISTLAQPLRVRAHVITKEGRSMVVDRRLRSTVDRLEQWDLDPALHPGLKELPFGSIPL
jgi:hypothetical protein